MEGINAITFVKLVFTPRRGTWKPKAVLRKSFFKWLFHSKFEYYEQQYLLDNLYQGLFFRLKIIFVLFCFYEPSDHIRFDSAFL